MGISPMLEESPPAGPPPPGARSRIFRTKRRRTSRTRCTHPAMHVQPRSRLVAAGVSLLIAHAVFATSTVPRSTFGRAPIRPADLSLLSPPERTPLPTTFPDITRQERTLPVTATTARTMKFEQQLTPFSPLAPLVPADVEPTRFRFVPAANPDKPPPSENPAEPDASRTPESKK